MNTIYIVIHRGITISEEEKCAVPMDTLLWATHDKEKADAFVEKNVSCYIEEIEYVGGQCNVRDTGHR